ncbi:ABC transporter permease [Campylobacter sputorum]|uniref:ABC transporter permease n=1 Tax=Campylobacter sputorum TaxID=206 RepID=UPI00053BF866|nr:ABC transporter permease [Campylobacter sputorum]
MNDFISYKKSSEGTIIFLNGNWTYNINKKVFSTFENIVKKSKNIILDLQNLQNIDYSMAIFLKSFQEKNGLKFKIINSNDKFNKIFNLTNDDKIDFKYIPRVIKESVFEKLGKKLIDFYYDFMMVCSFLGEFFVKFIKAFFSIKNFRSAEISNHIKTAGINSVFIVCLTSFLIGIVLVYLGSTMLSTFGATILIVEIMGMLTLREIGPMIAAIVIAGRSASSFTAQIGVMKITEEIDAMKTMGFDSFYFLTLPRVIAMIIVTPLVIFLADAVSIFGQMLVCNILLDIPIASYIDRFKEMVDIKHFLVGMIKAPFFGAAISIIGCLRGFEISGSTQSVGKFTTISVVNAIFWVIAIDALFAIVFMELGI